ncbi:hypothetical protein M413DRAFT_431293 [Hebeloma cylindrosporum]|uniref:Uncharacterized protein n=1 Tax=Hebeloma cylindrosporum TaxID=76867 RepID=A0A0C2Y2C6_HEBCY|nr:hypothetical protein M413DRAFT_431293 [Hebeloma cylindrosporum h7]
MSVPTVSAASTKTTVPTIPIPPEIISKIIDDLENMYFNEPCCEYMLQDLLQSESFPYRRELLVFFSLANSNFSIKHLDVTGVYLPPRMVKALTYSTSFMHFLSGLQTLEINTFPLSFTSELEFPKTSEFYPKFWNGFGILLPLATNVTTLSLTASSCTSGPSCETWDAMNLPHLTILELQFFEFQDKAAFGDINTGLLGFLQRHLQSGSRLSEIGLYSFCATYSSNIRWATVYGQISDLVSSNSYSALKSFKHTPNSHKSQLDPDDNYSFEGRYSADDFKSWRKSYLSSDPEAYARLQAIILRSNGGVRVRSSLNDGDGFESDHLSITGGLNGDETEKRGASVNLIESSYAISKSSQKPIRTPACTLWTQTYVRQEILVPHAWKFLQVPLGNAYGSLTHLWDLDMGPAPPSPTLSSHSWVHFRTTIALRDNSPEQNSSGLSSLALLNPQKTQGHSRKGGNASVDADPHDSVDTDINFVDDDKPRNVSMFANAQNLSIQDTTMNNVGGDMVTIIHNNYTYPEPDPSPATLLSQWSNLFSSARSHIFHAAEVIKGILPSGFLTSPAIKLEEKVAHDALKYPPLNAKILLSKTSMCIPGFVSQSL